MKNQAYKQIKHWITNGLIKSIKFRDNLIKIYKKIANIKCKITKTKNNYYKKEMDNIKLEKNIFNDFWSDQWKTQ